MTTLQDCNNDYACTGNNNNNTDMNMTYPMIASELLDQEPPSPEDELDQPHRPKNNRLLYYFTTVCILVQQLAVCTVFLSFVGTNLHAILYQWNPDTPVQKSTALLATLPVVLLLSLSPNLQTITPITATATVLLFSGFALLFVFMMMVVVPTQHQEASPADDSIGTSNLVSITLALCAILYSYEGICLVLPIEASFAEQKFRENTPYSVVMAQFSVLFWSAMTTAAVVFAIVSVLSVLVFGNVTNGSITAFLLQQYNAHDASVSWFEIYILHASNIVVSLAILITYPLQLFPALELIHKELFQNDSANGSPMSSLQAIRSRYNPIGDTDAVGCSIQPTSTFENEGLVRETSRQPSIQTEVNTSGTSFEMVQSTSDTIPLKPRLYCVGLTYLIALLVPNVESLISLAGALSGSTTGLILPPVLHLVFCKQRGIHGWMRIRDISLTVIGLFFLLVGTAASIHDIVQSYGKH